MTNNVQEIIIDSIHLISLICFYSAFLVMLLCRERKKCFQIGKYLARVNIWKTPDSTNFFNLYLWSLPAYSKNITLVVEIIKCAYTNSYQYHSIISNILIKQFHVVLKRNAIIWAQNLYVIKILVDFIVRTSQVNKN